MLDLTYNDYFTTQGTGNTWKPVIKNCTNKIIDNYHNELLRAARLIYEQSTSPIVLLYSGGLDGEFMINIFKKAKIPYKVAIITYGKYNLHDTQYAFEFCENNNINPIIVDIDIKKFIETGKIYEIANSVKCAAYQMPSVMHGLEKLDGTLVMANGEPYLKNYEGTWMYEETERVNSYMRWYTDNKIDGTPDFLRYTPESTYAFIQEPIVKELRENTHTGKLSTRTSKHKLYSNYYRFIPRPKFTGWEQLEKENFFNEVYENFLELRSNHNGVYSIEATKLLEELTRIKS